jgi:class 3 adenylate cyclase/tetratricopeptide (TPR) repeat protein
VAESVELATILLTDLVGSTRLATSVGPVRADELREEHFELLRDAIASRGGKEVKNTGDGLMVAFSSASAAVQCAVAMQQLFERRYRHAEQALHIRVGLGAGESTVKDGDYFGMPSIEAARLCAQASADGILVSAGVKMFAGRCEGVEFSSAGELELKGFPDPVEAFSVSWTPLAQEAGEPAGRWPLPASLRSVPPVRYVGRVEERAGLQKAMTLARSGQRQVVLLSGEPGIGKTRLASYGAHDARAEGFAVGWGACTEELAVPYEPWIGVCSQIVEHAPQELLAVHVERHGGELSRLSRELRTRIPDLPDPQSSDPDTERYLLFGAVTGLLTEVAQAVAVCVVLDDLHWADAQSLALLKHLLRSSEQGSLQVIATFRDSDLGKDHPLTAVLADLRSLQGVQRIALHGLGADEVAEIMSAVAGHELEADGLELAARIATETDGNPFFVGEVLRGLSESGALAFDEGAQRWSIDSSAAIALPESVREVIERRVERLGAEPLEALRLAAVIGREFDLDLLSAVAESDEAQLLDHLEAAVAASLLSESSDRVGRFRFVHALINQTLHEGLGATRRARMHQRVAQALEQLYGDDPGEHMGELAHHWAAATSAVDLPKAVTYARMAGEHALSKLAPDEAVRWFSQALELLGDKAEPSQRCELLIGLGEAQRQSGNAAFRETLLKASGIASELTDAELAARAALANSRGEPSAYGQVDEERVGAIERALELHGPDGDPATRALLLSLQSLELAFEFDHRPRREPAEQALALAREADDARTLAGVLINYFYAVWAPDTLARRRELLPELLDSAGRAGDPALEFWAANRERDVFMEGGEVQRAETAAQRATAIAEKQGEPTARWIATSSAACQALLRGDLASAERLAEEAMQIGADAGQPDTYMLYAGQLQEIRLYQGRGGELIELLEQSVAANPGIPAWRGALAQILGWTGRTEQSAAVVADAATDGFEHVRWDQIRLSTLAMYAEAATLAGASDAAGVLYELIEPWADQIAWVGAITYGQASTYLGLLATTLGRHERADEHFKRSCEFHEANELWLWAARAHLGWAQALADRGETAQAREHATQALELSREHGYGLFEPRAAALVESPSAAGA